MLTNCKLHCGVRCIAVGKPLAADGCANCGFSFRSSVSFGQERSPKSATTTCTNRQTAQKLTLFC